MGILDEYKYLNGKTYIETEHGPNVWWKCQECGERAAVSPEGSVCRCQSCWAKLAGVHIGQPLQLEQDQWRKATPSPKVRRDLFWHPRSTEPS